MTETSPAAAVVQRLALRRRLPPPDERRAVRKASGLSAAEIGACLGVTRQTVAQWERGIRTPRGDHLEQYIAVLEQLAHETRTAS